MRIVFKDNLVSFSTSFPHFKFLRKKNISYISIPNFICIIDYGTSMKKQSRLNDR